VSNIRRPSRAGAVRLVAGAVVFALCAAACGSSSKSSTPSGSGPATNTSSGTGPIKLGGLFPLSGPYAPFGVSELKGIQGLIKLMNSDGGIDGRQLEFTSKNTNLDPATAASEAQQLIDDGVVAVISAGTETEAPAAVPVFMKAKVPVLFWNPGDTWGDGAKWPYYFSTSWATAQYAESLVNFAQKHGATKVGLAADSTGFGKEFSNDVTTAAAAVNLNIVKTVSYDVSAVDVSTQMQQIKDAGADSLIIGGGGGFSQAFAGLQTIGYSPNIYSFSSIWFLPKLGGLEGTPLAQKAFATSAYCLPASGVVPPTLDKAANAVKDASGSYPPTGDIVIPGYDVLQILKLAIETSKSTKGPDIKQQIESISGKSFILDDHKYTYTSSNHDGLKDIPVCVASVAKGIGPDGIPYLAP
jgi:branched-chain amino acid transport system substrate-binding protein